MQRLPLVFACLISLLGLANAKPTSGESSLTQTEMVELLKRLDERQQNGGDYRMMAYLEQKQAGKDVLAYELTIYRRDDQDQLMMLFQKPKLEAGKGYLRLDRNLFIYDPTVGKWERRTDRERIGGTGSRRTDFDESRLAQEYDPAYVASERLGKHNVHHLKLTVKSGIDVAYPTIDLWVDQDSETILKTQDRALSNKLMRTSYYPKWEKRFSPSKQADVYFPKQIHIFDEVEKGNQTQIVFKEIDLSSLPRNIFTKAWLESKSR
jgi:hypothetical protein